MGAQPTKHHHWRPIGDDGTIQTFQCLCCRGKLTTRKATPDDRTGIRQWSLGGVTLRLERKQGPPHCEGRGTVKVTLQGRHQVKVRA